VRCIVVAIMLAAGEGTRCYPFTYLSPKIAQEICGIPLLEYMLSWFGGTKEIEKLFIVVREDKTVKRVGRYVAKRNEHIDKIIKLFCKLGYDVDYVNRDFEIEMIRANGWETGGDLRFALRHISDGNDLGKEFLVCNGDYVILRKLENGNITTQMNLSDIMEYHRRCSKALGTVVTDALFPVARKDIARFGVASLKNIKGFNVIDKFIEKPGMNGFPENVAQIPVNAGVYVMDKNYIFSDIEHLLPDKPKTKLERTLLERLANETAANPKNPKLAGFLLNLFGWFDVGTLEQLIDVSVNIANKVGGYITPPRSGEENGI
jgi:NDP-sugar pyrophosphorylase family protein